MNPAAVTAAIKLSSPATREFWEIPVLFEDDDLLALDKPAGLRVSPDPDDAGQPCLLKLLHTGINEGKPWARARNLTHLANAHRLDFESSGVLLLAKNKPALDSLTNEFGSGKPSRKYACLVWGHPAAKNFSVDAPLAPHPVKSGRMCVDAKAGKKSRTEFELLEQFSDWALLRGEPLTDRNHQVRVHLKHAGHPVVGDEIYGGKKLWLSRLKSDYRLKEGRDERPLISRPALHLEELVFTHPASRAPCVITSECPKDMRVALKYLRRYGLEPRRINPDHAEGGFGQPND